MNLLLDFLGKYLPVIIIGGGIIFVIAPKFFLLVVIWVCGWLILFLFFFLIDKSLNFNFFKEKKLNAIVTIFGVSSAFFLIFIVMFGPAALLILFVYGGMIVGVGLSANYILVPLVKEIDKLGLSKNWNLFFGILLIIIFVILLIIMIIYTAGTALIYVNNFMEFFGINYFSIDK